MIKNEDGNEKENNCDIKDLISVFNIGPYKVKITDVSLGDNESPRQFRIFEPIEIEGKFPVGFPFVLKGTINGLTVVPSVKKGAEIHSWSNAKTGNQIEVVLAAQVKTIEVGLVVRISVRVFCYFS